MATVEANIWPPILTGLEPSEERVFGVSAEEGVAALVPVSQAQLTHVGTDGTLGFTAMFWFPKGFFDLPGARFYQGPELAKAIGDCFMMDVVPHVRIIVRKDKVALLNHLKDEQKIKPEDEVVPLPPDLLQFPQEE